METLLQCLRGALTVGILIACIEAQHLQATASFTSGDSASFSLTNFDVANSGSGNIYKWNGQAVNWYIEWTRTGTVVSITFQGALNSWLDGAAQGSAGGDAHLNTGGAGTPGTWTRNP